MSENTIYLYLIVLTAILCTTLYFLYQFGQIVIKIKSKTKEDSIIIEQLDKAIDQNIKRIATLEYELKKKEEEFLETRQKLKGVAHETTINKTPTSYASLSETVTYEKPKRMSKRSTKTT